MRKVMVISIICAVILSACGNVSETAETSEVSQTAVTVTSAKEEKDTSEAATTTFKTDRYHSNYDQEIKSVRLFGKFQSGTEQFCTE